MKLITISALLLFSISAQASLLKSFTAKFDVYIYSFNVGQAKHQFNCQADNCTLTSEAKPPSWARRFINESAIETIQIKQTSQQFDWQTYTKNLTRHYDDRTEYKTITLKKSVEDKQIQFVEQSEYWPIQTDVYDLISIVYAIQYKHLNKQPMDQLYLQGDKHQEAVTFIKKAQDTDVSLEFEHANLYEEDEKPAIYYEFKTSKEHIKLWLLKQENYFPGKIKVYSASEDRTVTLELADRPEYK